MYCDRDAVFTIIEVENIVASFKSVNSDLSILESLFMGEAKLAKSILYDFARPSESNK